jgi:hypothetical protein
MHSMGFHRRFAVLLLALLLGSVARGAAVEGLYEGIVSGDSASSDRTAVASEALKQVVVRLTGRRSATADPSLAPVLSQPLRFAQTYRSVAPGQVAVGFDARALDSALIAAGQRLWGRERPLTLLVVVNEHGGATANPLIADADSKRDLERSAQQRGLPVVWATGLDAASAQVRLADALAGRLEPLRALARQFGADGVLVGKAAGAGSSWSWLGPAGTGALVGPPAEALNSLADRYGAQFGTQPAAPVSGALGVSVRGVRDLAGYALASQSLAAIDGVRDLAVDEASGDSVRFRLGFSGDADAFRQAAAQGGRLLPDSEAAVDGAVHFVLRP